MSIYKTLYRLSITAALSVVLVLVFSSTNLVQAAQQLNVPQGNASLNWSGYVADGNTGNGSQVTNQINNYTSVTGTWTIPAVSANTSGTADATWVGIGGVESHDLIQAGTQALVEGGSVSYSAWIEKLPGFSQTISLPVNAGDSITATINQESSGVWRITIQDNTSGKSYSATTSYDSSLSSAEWVEEMVSNGNGTFRPLDSFGTVSFTAASATVNGQAENLTQLNAAPLQMVNGAGQQLATASGVGNDSASFSVARTNASAASAVPRAVTGGRWHIVQTATSTDGQPMPTITVVRSRRAYGYTYRMSIPLGFTFSVIRL